jgi:putrescine aminotransferase
MVLDRTTEEWQRIDAVHHIHPFTDSQEIAKEGARVFVRGEGLELEDSEGRRFIDAMAGLWCVQLGYGRSELADAAHAQMLELGFYNTFFKTTTRPITALSEKLATLTPAGLDHFLFSNSGSEAVDTAVRLIRHFWNLQGQPEKNVIIGREFGYHGSTMASASVGGFSIMHAHGGLPLAGFEHVMPPYWYVYGGDLSPDDFGMVAANAIEQKILELGPERVAAFIGEPVLGAGGVIVPPQTYWPEVQRICRKHDVLLLADEVICGFGRTGNWWGSETFEIEPDLMTMAKGITSGYLPLSALALGPRVAGTLMQGDFAHGFTYSGHPTAAAVALENIRLIEEEGIVERVRNDTGPYLQEQLRLALADHPLVGEIRGVGLLAAVELAADKQTRQLFPADRKVGVLCYERCLDHGVIPRGIRNAVALSPALVATRSDIDEIVRRLVAGVDDTAERLRSEGWKG